MISLLNLMLLIGRSVIKGPVVAPKQHDAEYLDISIIPTVVVSKVAYRDFFSTDNLAVGIKNISLLVSKVYYRDFSPTENLTVGISNINLIVTKTGTNPL